jgi:hypothetical protein
MAHGKKKRKAFQTKLISDVLFEIRKINVKNWNNDLLD